MPAMAAGVISRPLSAFAATEDGAVDGPGVMTISKRVVPLMGTSALYMYVVVMPFGR